METNTRPFSAPACRAHREATRPLRSLAHCALLLGLVLALATPAGAQRQTATLNDHWQFQKPGDAAWQTVNIPHHYNDEAYRQRDYYRGPATYRRTLSLPSLTEGRRYYLKMDGVNKAADVSLNGKAVGSHAGGYSAFALDLTPYLQAGDNLLEVAVDNSRQDIVPLSADFTFFGGIYRDVWLITTPEQHFLMDGLGAESIFLSTPSVSAESATLRVLSHVTNDAATAANLVVRSDIYSPGGELLQTLTKKVKLKAGETQAVDCLSRAIASPQLWSPDSPALYRVVTTLCDAKTGQELDRQTRRTGLRWFAFDPDKGFALNGQPLKLRGLNRHQDQAPMGIALDDDAHRRDVRLMKELGCNFFRISHYPQDDAILDACDELGILAWEEIPTVNYVGDAPGHDDNCETNLREMIRQHYNHPSVILWGYMNEILLYTSYSIPGMDAGHLKDRAVELARRLEAVAKEEDPSRATTIAFHGSEEYPKLGLNLTDVTGWNLYLGWYSNNLEDFDRWCADQHRLYPDDPIIVSEWGAGSDRRLHSTRPVKFDFSMEYQQEFVEHYLKHIEETPYICGATYWNLIDFNVSTRQESMPRVNNKGLVYNASREYKDVAYYFKAMWRQDIPVVHIASRSHTHRIGALDQPQAIKVYSNMPEVELLVNGKSVGRQPTNNCHTVFAVVLPEGRSSLVARGVRSGVAAEDALVVSMSGLPDLARGETLAINVGSLCSFTSDFTHLTWLPDQAYSQANGWGYEGGTPCSTTTEIVQTLDNPLFQTWRSGELTYRIDAPAGEYEVELLMADASRPSEMDVYLLGKKGDAGPTGTTFDVLLCGQVVEKALSVSDGGKNFFTAFRRRYIARPVDGALTIALRAVEGEPFISGIKVRKTN